jgi:hypothetical protein
MSRERWDAGRRCDVFAAGRVHAHCDRHTHGDAQPNQQCDDTAIDRTADGHRRAGGAAAVYPLLLTPLNGFTGTVALTCAPVIAAQYASCSVLASTLTLNGNAQSSTATINTLTMTAILLHLGGPVCALLLPLLAPRQRRRRPRGGSCARAVMLACAALAASAALCSCGSKSAATGGSGSGVQYTPAGTYQYQVTASSTSGAALSSTVTLNLIVQ